MSDKSDDFKDKEIEAFYTRQFDQQVSSLPEDFQQKFKEINESVSIKTLLGIVLTMDNISMCLNVEVELLQKLGAKEHLMDSLLIVRDIENTFATDFCDKVENLDNAVKRSERNYLREIKDTLDNSCKELSIIISKGENLSYENKQIKMHLRRVKNSVNEQNEFTERIETNLSKFFKNLNQYTDSFKKVAKGIRTFSGNVNGCYLEAMIDLNDKTQKVMKKNKEIQLNESEANSLSKSLEDIESTLESNRRHVGDKERSCLTAESNSKEKDLDVKLQNKYIELTNNRIGRINAEQNKLAQQIAVIRAQKDEKKRKFQQQLERVQALAIITNKKAAESEALRLQYNSMVKNWNQKSGYCYRTNEYDRKMEQINDEHEIALKLSQIEKAEFESQKRYLYSCTSSELDTLIGEQSRLQMMANNASNELLSSEQQIKNFQGQIVNIEKEKQRYELQQKQLQNEIKHLEAESIEKKKKLTSINETLESNKKLKVQLEEDQQKAQQLFEITMKKLIQLKRLQVPNELLQKFTNIEKHMIDFQTLVHEHKNALKNLQDNLEDTMTSYQKKQNLLGEAEEVEEVEDAMKKLEITVDGIREEIGNQVERYLKINNEVKSSYNSFFDYQNEKSLAQLTV